MKKYFYLIVLTTFLTLLPGSLFATDWSKPDKGYFKFQKDVDNSVSDFSKGMASINHEGMIFNFVNYSNEVIVRKFSNSGALNLKWSQDQKSGIKNLTGLSGEFWQPAPVVFDDQLILFVVEKDNTVSYTTYNSGDNSWSERKTVYSQGSTTYKVLSKGMAAVVVGEKLCLVSTDDGTSLVINWTEDLETWHDSGLLSDLKIENDDWFQQISAISSSFIKDGARKEKLIFAYINTSNHPVSCEYYFDDNDKPVLLSKKTISTETTYQSVALVEGTVMGDNGSTGRCIQAFIKKDNKDNGYIRYRIQRYQLKDNAKSWTEQENNLLKQNYGWATKRVNLTAVNFPVPDGNDIRQFICLIYRSYDDWNCPMNIAWAESDKLVYDPSGQLVQEFGGPENTQYVGYIEGPPPFYLNNENGIEEPYLNFAYNPISELEFTTSNSQSSETQMGFDVGGSVSFHYSWFKASLSYSLGKVWGSEFKKTVKHSITVYAKPEAKGYYLTFTPIISRARYFQNDTYGNRIDTIYYFSMTEPKFNIEAVDLKNGFVPGDPITYLNRKDINFAAYNTSMYGKSDISWVGGTSTSTSIEVESSESVTTTHTVKLELGADLGEVFGIGVDGKFEYSLKTTTSVGNELLCKAALNQAVEATDITKLNYDVYWIKPILGNSSINNNWLHEGAEDQETWYITYDVTRVELKDGTSYKSLVPSVSQQLQNQDETSFVVFNADETKSGILLTWKTANDADNCSFEIQRSVKNTISSIEDYETIGTVTSTGNTVDYNFTDVNPVAGIVNYRIKQIAEDNSYLFSKVIGVEVAGQLPEQFSLSQNYPNPFNPVTKIRYQVAENLQNAAGQNGNTKLVVFDVLGNEVATLVNEYKEPGYYEVEFNASQISAGVYFYRLESGNFSAVKKLILLK